MTGFEPGSSGLGIDPTFNEISLCDWFQVLAIEVGPYQLPILIFHSNRLDGRGDIINYHTLGSTSQGD